MVYSHIYPAVSKVSYGLEAKAPRCKVVRVSRRSRVEPSSAGWKWSGVLPQVVARSLLPNPRTSEWYARSSNVRSGRATFYERDQRLRPLVVGVVGGKRLHWELVLHGIRASYRRVEGHR